MRPRGIHGEVRQALLTAATTLTTPERAPTLRELAQTARVGYDAALHTVKNMIKAGDLRSPRARRVEYRNRPVAEYEPAPELADCHATGYVDLGTLQAVWK